MGTALHAETQGDPAAGTPLVLLHGFGMRAVLWQPVIDHLPPAVPVIAYDLPGHAGSFGVEPGGAGRSAKAVVADLDQRGITRFHLCGHSLGGATAALIALRAPERVASLSLLAPGGFGPEINAEALATWRDAADEASLQAGLVRMLGQGFEVTPAMVSALAEARALPGAHAALSAIYETMFVPGPERHQGTLPLADLSKLTCPVSVLWGTEDHILPVTHCDGLPDNVRVERLVGAGHMLVEERTGDVVRVLRAMTAST